MPAASTPPRFPVSDLTRRAAQLGDIPAEVRELVDSIQDVFYRVDARDTVVATSRSAVKVLGYDNLEELVGRPAAALWAEPAARGAFLAALRERGELNDYEIDLLRADGTAVPIATTVRVVRDADGAYLGYQGIWRDISERRQAEEALRLSEEKFAQVFLMFPDTIAISRLSDGRILDINPGFEKATLWPRSEAIGRTTIDLELWADPQQRRTMVEALRAGREVLDGDIAFKRRDGVVCEGLYSARPIRIAGEACLVFVMRDVSERRAAARQRKLLEDERAEMEAQLRQVQKLEAIGQIAGGVAHDFNNLLAVQMSCLQLLSDVRGVPEEARDLLADLERSTRAAVELTRQLLAFGRRQVLQREPIEVGAFVTAFSKMLRRVVRENVRIALELDGGPYWIDADGSMLQQVLMNLAVNSQDAMPAGGVLTIRVDAVDGSEEPPREEPSPESAFVRLTVRDTGHGMDEVTRLRVFDPFFTTKPMGKGTGLGLATVYGIVKQHGGIIEVESESGRGSAFLVRWPRIEPPGLLHGAPDLPRGPRPQGATVLVVEDEPAVRRMLSATLSRWGYRVIEAADGEGALLLCRELGRGVDVVLSDVVMPGLGGTELAHRLGEDDPTLPVILTSGYSMDLATHGVPEGVRFLAKPLERSALQAALDAAIAQRRAPRAG